MPDIKPYLSITLIQSELHWQSIDANLAMFEEKIWQIENPTDVIILPEMFNTGFTMEVKKFAEHSNGNTFRWMKQMAAQTKALIIGSFIVNDQGFFYNRLFWVEPDGSFAKYDKRHLFRMADEHHYFTMGKERLVKSWKGWRICPLVCYDLRFPVWSRNILKSGAPEYDLLIYIANWPEARVSAWSSLLIGRAVENLTYVAGVNRVGKDGKDISYNGCSAVISPKGDTLWKQQDDETIRTIILDSNILSEFREKFPAFLDGDEFDIKL